MAKAKVQVAGMRHTALQYLGLVLALGLLLRLALSPSAPRALRSRADDRGSAEDTASASASGAERTVRVACFGDTHGKHDQVLVPDADILVFTGDCTDPSNPEPNVEQVRAFNAWLGRLPHEHKFVVAGNHDADGDMALEDLPKLFSSATYLEDESASVEVRGRRISVFGSPWEPQYPGRTHVPAGPQLERAYAKVPDGVDVLATHSPPKGHFDRDPSGARVGAEELAAVVDRLRPALHCFGHVHTGREKEPTLNGPAKLAFADAGGSRATTTFVNGAVVDDDLVIAWAPKLVTLIV